MFEKLLHLVGFYYKNSIKAFINCLVMFSSETDGPSLDIYIYNSWNDGQYQVEIPIG
jgi:hypothetical protein